MAEGTEETFSSTRKHGKSLSLSSTDSIALDDQVFTKGNKKCSEARERSKTPPANMQKFSDAGSSLKNSEEKSRDSGVHLDFPPGQARSEEGAEAGRRHAKSSSLPHGVKLCSEDDKRKEEDKLASLENELRKTQYVLKERDAEVEILKGIRTQVEGELEDLTASLFQEAHRMVTEAKMKEVASEKSLTETRMQLEGLQAEVAALKMLLITSTPSRPNLNSNSNGISIFKKQHKRTPSHNHLQYGRSSDDEGHSGAE